MLKPSHDNSRGNANLLCETPNIGFAQSAGFDESLVLVRRDEKILCKAIRLLFLFTATDVPASFVFCLDEDILFPMKKNMARFMKEGEPEMVVAFAPQTQLDHCLVAPIQRVAP